MKRIFFFLLFFSLLSSLYGETVTADPPPGTYNQDQTVSFRLSGYDADMYYFFEESEDPSPVLYTVPILLSAMSGEERSYTIRAAAVPKGRELSKETVFEEKVFSYTVDKRLPGSPSASVPSGVYYDDLTVTFQYRTDQSVYFSLIGDDQPIEITQQWDGEPLVLEGRKGSVSRYALEVFSYDHAGNRSPVMTYQYLIDKQEEEKIKQIKVLSPAEGSFANRQLLYIRHSGYGWVRYSLDGSSPVTEGQPYERPMIIPDTGAVTVRVAAFDESEKKIVERTIKFRVDANPREILSLESGVYAEEKTVKKNGEGEYRISMNDSRPEEWAPLAGHEPITLEVTENAQKPLFIRLLNDAAPDRPEYRYVYVMDGREPVEPEIYLFERSRGGEKGVEVAILGPNYGTIHYTVDGQTPNRLSPPYAEPFFISYEGSARGGGRRIKAVTVDTNGNVSGIIEREVQIPEKRTLKPPLIDEGPDGAYTLKHPENVKFVYETGKDRQNLVEPSLSSPAVSSTFTYSLPFGFDETRYLQFAAADGDGNISEPSRVLRIDIDNNPPTKPMLRYERKKLIIESEKGAEIFYAVSEDNEDHPDVNETAVPYEGPIQAHAEEGLKKTYTLSAYAVDAAGNRSQISGPQTFSNDLRSPSPPLLSGAEDGGNYRELQVLRFTLEKADETILYTYTLDGSPPPEPDFSSTTAEDRTIVFEGRENSSVQVRLKYAAALPGPRRIGKVHELSFVIDRKPPAVPEPAGFEHKQVYTSPVYVAVPEQEEGVEYMYGLARGNETPPDCFGKYGQQIKGTVEFDLPEGEEERFSLMFGARDRAGNKIYNNRIYTFTIDKKGPDNPQPIGIPSEPVNEPVVISFDSAGEEIYYEFSEGVEVPERPSVNSFLYSSPIRFEGNPESETVYTIKFRARDSAGNFSPHAAVYSFVIDKKPPRSVEKPFVRNKSNGIIISWPPRKHDSIFLSLQRDGETVMDWQKFTGELSIPAEELTRTVILHAYRMDGAGNKSDTSSFEIWRDLFDPEQMRLFPHIEDGTVYNEPVTIEPADENTVIKYEVAFHGLEPTDVTVFSEELTKPLTLDVLSGETKEFSIKARLYDIQSNNFISEEQTVSFAIDRTPPPPPEIVVKSGEQDYFQSDVKIGIGAPEGTVFYKIKELDAFNNVLEEGEFRPYTDEIVLYAEEGRFKTYDILSYSVDDAGNKSRTASRTGIVIDKQIIYVSDSGNDNYPGSRSRPLKSVGRAVETAASKERGIIMIASGTYKLEQSVTLPANLTLLGGYHSSTWERNKDEPTVITEGRYLPSGSAFFICREEKIQLSTMEFAAGEKGAVPVHVVSGSTRMEKVLFRRLEEAESPVLRQTGGRLTVVNSSFISEANGFSPLVETEKAEKSTFSGCIFEGAQDMQKDSTLLSLKNVGEGSITDSTLQPGRGRTASALYAENSNLNIAGCLLYSGSGTVRSVSLHLEKSTCTGNNLLIQTDSSSRITSGIIAYDSELTLSESTFQLGGQGGSVGIYTEASTCRIEGSIIKGNPESEFLHLFRSGESDLSIFNSIITSSMTGDFVGFDIERGSADIFNNTMVLEFGPGNSYLLRAQKNPELRIINNIMIQAGREVRGTVLYSEERGDRFELAANNIHGWDRILRREGETVSDTRTLNELDGDPFGGRFHKNIAETLYETFLVTKEEPVFRLKQSSGCVNGGIDVSEIGGPAEDYEGEPRPNPEEGLKPEYDIGADEF